MKDPTTTIIATYRDPSIKLAELETERLATRETRWRMHRLKLASLIFHSVAVGANLAMSTEMVRQGRWLAAGLQMFIAGGVNALALWYFWRGATKSFS